MMDEDSRPPLEAPALTSSSAQLVHATRHQLRNVWEYDAGLLAKFFPVDDNIRVIFQKYKKTLYGRTRWSGIPVNPKTVSRLYTPLNNLINNLLVKFNLTNDYQGNGRLSMNTSKGLQPQLNQTIRPPLLLTGSGPHFVTSAETRPEKDYASGISAIEVRLEHQDGIMARDRLAANMKTLITQQYNRRYAFGLVISQRTLTVYMFDHSGVVESPSFDYHAMPEQFCAIIVGLASHEGGRQGFDTSMVREGSEYILYTKEGARRKNVKEVKYSLLSMLYYASDIVGRGTICFAALEKADPETRYVIKDSWVAVDESEGKESEASLITLARSLGVSKGIPTIRYSGDVNVVGDTGRVQPDTVLNNRRAEYMKYERVHTRLIMTPFGKPLDKFSNRKEFLLAYHDAIQAHRSLFEVAGILHRDIKPQNILIDPQGGEGNRGILIDFDHAIRVADTSPYSTKKKIGTYLFMSRNALEGGAQTYLDDLESFYYVLLYISFLYTGPGSTKREWPLPLDHWDKPLASHSKNGFIAGKFIYRATPWLGKPYQTLLERLHSIFRNIFIQNLLAEENKNNPPVVHSAEVYDMMLSHVRDAVEGLNDENEAGHNNPSAEDSMQVEVDGSGREETTQSSRESKRRSPKCGPKRVMMTLAANRTRRVILGVQNAEQTQPAGGRHQLPMKRNGR